MQENVTIEEVANKQSNMTEEATRMWLETVKAVSRIEKRHHEEMGNLRRQMTRNYNCLMKEIDKSKEIEEAMHAEIAKKWIRDNLEEAQQMIDNIVGIKGITENPLKAAVEAGIARETQNIDSISSTILPPSEELYGY
jgi:hypothetical protein